jgi:hydroxymethylpyrimidine pyrophosphatase-like HAD family hydrolase
MRGSVIFDECGFLSAEMIKVYGAFAIVNKNFKTGRDRDGNLLDPIRLMTIPTNVPNQKFYISSASSTDTEFYRLYREFSKRQLMGDPDYFVAHIDCEVAFHPTVHGQTVSPLLMQSTVETEMRTNPEKARREYYCEFTSDAGTDAIIRRGTIARNSEVRPPLLYNDTNDRKFVFAYDPARSRDNSVILIGEVYQDKNTNQIKCRLVNCVNLLDVGKKRKSPMQTPDQVEYLKELILDYNGDAPDYENIEAIYIDAGSGGGGVNIADYLMENWVDKKGKVHKGLIDKEYSADYVKKFPDAIDKVRLMQPTQYKSEMYEALIEMMNQDAISFTESYDNKGYLTVFEADEKELEKEKKSIETKLKRKKLNPEEYKQKLEEELKNASCVKTKTIKLDIYQEIALSNMDALKEELVNMVRKKRDSGKDSFELTPEKANKMHDDRASKKWAYAA